MQRAGRQPQPGPADDLGRAPAESWPALSGAATRHFTELLAAPELYCLVLPVLRQLHRQRRRLPHRLLRPTLAKLQELQWLPMLATYAPLFGERWGWLAAWHADPGLRQAAARATAGLRPGGPLTQRPAALTELLADAPAQAWQYVLTTLPTADEATRHDLLSWLARAAHHVPLPAALAPVLEQGPLPPYTAPDRYTAHRPAAQLWQVLRLVPGSVWAGRLWQRVADCLVLERPPGQPPRLRLTLPPDEAVDEAWRQDGLDPSPPYATATDRGWIRLHALLEYVAPSRWAAAWGVGADEAVALLAALPDPPTRHLPGLLETWLDAARALHDVAAIRAILAYLARTGQALSSGSYALLVLPPAEQVALLRAVLPPLPAPPTLPGMPLPLWLDWVARVGNCEPALPLAVAQLVLPFIRDYLRQPVAGPTPDLAPDLLGYQLVAIAATGSLALLPWYEAELPPLAQARPELARFTGPAINYLRLRQGLAAEAHEPPGPDR